MTTYFFDQDKLNAAIATFAFDKCSGRKSFTFGNLEVIMQSGSPAFTANDVAAFLREFFDAPTSAKLRTHKVGTAAGITGDKPAEPLPPRDTP